MKELLDSIIEFLEENLGENYIWITAGIAALLVVIIALAAAAGRKKKSADGEQTQPRDFFLEGEYDAMIRNAALASKAGNSPAEPEVPAEPEADASESVAAEEPEPETEPGEPVTEAETEPEEPEVIEGTAEEQDALKEELQQVHININIERGQVRIGYEEDGKVTCIVETEEDAPAEDPELTAALAAGEMEAEPAPEVPAGDRAELDKQGIILEKINLVKAAPAKKFGPDNFNTGRSGRVFTEEELREQIKQ